MGYFEVLGDSYMGKILIGDFVFITTVAVFGLFANAGLIYSVVRQPSLRKSPTYLTLVSLAASDFLSLATEPLFILFLSSKHVGFGLCSWYLYVIQAGFCCSVFHLITFSVLRYVILVKPLLSMKYLTVRTTIVTCAIIWTVSLTISSGSFSQIEIMSRNNSLNHTVYMCSYKTESQTYLIAVLVATVFIPMITIAIFHIAKVYQLRTQSVTAESGQRTQVSTKIIIAILIALGISSLPGGIYWSITLFGNDITIEMLAVGHVLGSLNYINNAVDPLFYFFFSDRARKDFCCCRLLCNVQNEKNKDAEDGDVRAVPLNQSTAQL